MWQCKLIILIQLEREKKKEEKGRRGKKRIKKYIFYTIPNTYYTEW